MDRAIDLDPYRAATYLVAAIHDHRKGLLGQALERYETAALLAPSDVEVRFHAGFGFLDAARQPALSDEEASELAEAASEHFEAVLQIEPGHEAAAMGAIESALYGKVTKLRDSLKRVFSRVPPAEALRPAMTRLFYQAIFAFRVGKAKSVDQKNKKTMADLCEVAKVWIAAFPGDPALGGVIAAAAAKCDTADEICERVATYAREIPDVRVLRMLLRERLADVADPQKRLSLFEGAMARIPALDGITHDYMQLRHLVAKRAAAEGDLAAAREAWLKCQEIDPDNPSTTQNLLRLARHHGDKAEASRLERKLAELWGLYVEVSPRADIVLRRKAASLQIEVDAELARIMESEERPKAAELIELARLFAHAQSLARLAVEPELLEAVGGDAAKEMLSGTTDEVFSYAVDVLGQPVNGQPPIAYAFFGVAKDASDDVIAKARDAWRESLERIIREVLADDGNAKPFQAVFERGAKMTKVLFDPASRAAYDAETCEPTRAEFYRLFAGSYRILVELGTAVADEQTSIRDKLAKVLSEIPREIARPYLVTTVKDEAWVEFSLLRIRYGGLLVKGWKLLNEGNVMAVIQLCTEQLAGAAKLATTHRLFTHAVLEDPRVPLWDAVDRARHHARTARELAHWSEPTADMVKFIEASDEVIAQHAAAERALRFMGEDKSREAVTILWMAYPKNRNKNMPRSTPASMAMTGLVPTGGGFYAFAVAKAMRGNVIQWYNMASPSSQGEVYELKRLAKVLTNQAGHWAVHARDNIASDPVRAAESGPILQAIRDLIGVLERDLRTLT